MRHNANGIAAGPGPNTPWPRDRDRYRRSNMVLGNVIQWSFITQQWSEIQADLVQHIQLTLIAVGLGLCIAIPLSLWWPGAIR